MLETIEVTAEDIAEGQKRSIDRDRCESCPVWQALARRFDCGIRVGHYFIEFLVRRDEPAYFVRLSDSVGEIIDGLDSSPRSWPHLPFSFQIDVPDRVPRKGI